MRSEDLDPTQHDINSERPKDGHIGQALARRSYPMGANYMQISSDYDPNQDVDPDDARQHLENIKVHWDPNADVFNQLEL